MKKTFVRFTFAMGSVFSLMSASAEELASKNDPLADQAAGVPSGSGSLTSPRDADHSTKAAKSIDVRGLMKPPPPEKEDKKPSAPPIKPYKPSAAESRGN